MPEPNEDNYSDSEVNNLNEKNIKSESTRSNKNASLKMRKIRIMNKYVIFFQ